MYPNGVKGAWAGPSYANATVQEDLQFVQDLVADVQSNNSIDASRIYATGLSNGAGFVGTLACSDVGGLFAAFAPVAGSFYTDSDFSDSSSCKPARSPLPILEIHGGSDKTVYYGGGNGEGGFLPAIPDWYVEHSLISDLPLMHVGKYLTDLHEPRLAAWAERNGCGANSTVDSDNGNVHHTSWSCQGSNNVLQHWKVDKNGRSICILGYRFFPRFSCALTFSTGHDWPSKTINFDMIAAGMGPQPIEANDIVIDFFDQFSLP